VTLPDVPLRLIRDQVLLMPQQLEREGLIHLPQEQQRTGTLRAVVLGVGPGPVRDEYNEHKDCGPMPIQRGDVVLIKDTVGDEIVASDDARAETLNVPPSTKLRVVRAYNVLAVLEDD
jgi:co-chaperonin GroES (HSP10)